jgi:glycosyltransferase involved in cell wall biosynthesis
MLTWSNWKTEPRSNRYHYGSRFARHVPVLFVQPDGEPGTTESTELRNLDILHVGSIYHADQLSRVHDCLGRRGLTRPLLWIYNPRYTGLENHFRDALRVYHATEDYFTNWRSWRTRSRWYRYEVLKIRCSLVSLLQAVDLVVTVTDGVGRRIRSFAQYGGPILVLENGCDFSFWDVPALPAPHRERKIALYQGGINDRLDTLLLGEVMQKLPDWEFHFCGALDPDFAGWESLRRRPNCRYLGSLDPKGLRNAMYASTAALIPFVQEPYITRQSLPLKAFEYAACGLPTVSVPIDALSRHERTFKFATNADEFAAALTKLAATRFVPADVQARKQVARQQSYDRRFDELTAQLAYVKRSRSSPTWGARARIVGLELAANWNRFLFKMQRALAGGAG